MGELQNLQTVFDGLWEGGAPVIPKDITIRLFNYSESNQYLKIFN